MNIVCAICSDLLTPSADIFHTPCGHIFHYACLTQWLQRSKSCPQCREKTTSHKIHRVLSLKERALAADSMEKENEQLKGRIETYKNIETLLEASTEDIDDMVSRTCDPSTLITYISVMKREMASSLNKRRELRSKVRSLQEALTKATMERKFLSEEHKKRKKIEEDLMICESEKMALQNKLRELEKNTPVSKRAGIFDFDIENNSDGNVENISKQNAAKGTIPNKNMNVEDIKDERKNVAAGIANMEKTNDSPYLPVRSAGLFGLKQVPVRKRGIITTNSKSSIFTKRPRTEQTSVHSITYDGFGGHSKYDKFPSSSDRNNCK
ncbi:TRAF interacting protein no poles isoform X2 [Lasioglossum baleicum]|uniref:TRAF interacting protein no poles isoform X2 n=1 Tax=Lasioglossum baleicum TaxID=434251 RepID=UPI003FCD05B0